MTREEKRTVKAVFGELMKMDYHKLTLFLGSETIRDMEEMYNRLRYEPYCKRHGIRYEDMTNDDYEMAYAEEM